MSSRRRRGLGLTVAVIVLAGCGGATATIRLASTFEEFAIEHCAAAQAIFRGYGNPDTAGLSPMMQAFEDAIERGDAITAAAKGAELKAEFERGRQHVRIAAGWAPGQPALGHLDRFLTGMARMVDAELAALSSGSGPASQAGQAAFEAASGPEDWFGWLEGLGAAMKEAGVSKLPACEGVPF